MQGAAGKRKRNAAACPVARGASGDQGGTPPVPFWRDDDVAARYSSLLPSVHDPCLASGKGSSIRRREAPLGRSWFSWREWKRPPPSDDDSADDGHDPSSPEDMPAALVLACESAFVNPSCSTSASSSSSSARKSRKVSRMTKWRRSKGTKRRTGPPAEAVDKIRVYPTPQQRDKWKKWFGTCRWTYNKCLEAVLEDRTALNVPVLRKRLVNTSNFKKPPVGSDALDLSWVTETPMHIRDQAMKELVQAYETNRAKGKSDREFRVKFRSKKAAPQESITIEKKEWNRQRGYYANMFGKHLRAERPLPRKVRHDFKIVRTSLGEYYLCLPRPLRPRGDNQALGGTQATVGGITRGDTSSAIALDPGVRTFHTGYDTSGHVTQIAPGGNRRLAFLCTKLDDLISRTQAKDVRHRRRYKMRKAAARMRRRIRNLVDEVHKKAATWLCRTYRRILIPKFDTARMTKRQAKRHITNRTARMMYTWAHYRFRQRLINKAREYRGRQVIEVGEDYTTRTCGRCGHRRDDLKGAKVYACVSEGCGYVADRDANAARNILLKFLVDHARRKVTVPRSSGRRRLARLRPTTTTTTTTATGARSGSSGLNNPGGGKSPSRN